MDYKNYIAEKLNIDGVDVATIASFIEVPPSLDMGDYALPCFKLAKIMRKAPNMIAEDLASSFKTDGVICNCLAINGYLNFKVNRLGLAIKTLDNVLAQKEKYGSSDIGKGKNIIVEYSSINIAKPFHIGHLSTTVIGSSLYKIYKFFYIFCNVFERKLSYKEIADKAVNAGVLRYIVISAFMLLASVLLIAIGKGYFRFLGLQLLVVNVVSIFSSFIWTPILWSLLKKENKGYEKSAKSLEE